MIKGRALRRSFGITGLMVISQLFVFASSVKAEDNYVYAYNDDPYEHRCWKNLANCGKTYGQCRTARASFVDHHDWQENFNLKFSNDWLSETADSPDYIYAFDNDVRGGLSIKAAAPGTTVSELANDVIEHFQSRVKSSGGRVLAVSSRPVVWAGMNARRIEQKFSYKDLPAPITCVTLVAESKGRAFKLELAQFDRLYNSRDYRPLIETCIASFKVAEI